MSVHTHTHAFMHTSIMDMSEHSQLGMEGSLLIVLHLGSHFFLTGAAPWSPILDEDVEPPTGQVTFPESNSDRAGIPNQST